MSSAMFRLLTAVFEATSAAACRSFERLTGASPPTPHIAGAGLLLWLSSVHGDFWRRSSRL
uniref:Uncharacterized protein n=1 Tax=Thermocrispum agreste TaxID=37925 RepID=A0A2W4J9K2_9PSEU|nr:MAG: hypothetical protein DIU77_12870 [Thermocrispum agreste]